MLLKQARGFYANKQTNITSNFKETITNTPFTGRLSSFPYAASSKCHIKLFECGNSSRVHFGSCRKRHHSSSNHDGGEYHYGSADSQIRVTLDEYLGTKFGVTCNSAGASEAAQILRLGGRQGRVSRLKRALLRQPIQPVLPTQFQLSRTAQHVSGIVRQHVRMWMDFVADRLQKLKYFIRASSLVSKQF
jgi:hypothetical protein